MNTTPGVEFVSALSQENSQETSGECLMSHPPYRGETETNSPVETLTVRFRDFAAVTRQLEAAGFWVSAWEPDYSHGLYRLEVQPAPPGKISARPPAPCGAATAGPDRQTNPAIAGTERTVKLKMQEMFPSRFLRGVDIVKPVRVVIADCVIEEVGEKAEEKPVVHFEGGIAGLVLNKTNGDMLASLFGDDSDDWVGKAVVLEKAKVQFQGKLVDCVRIRPARMPAKPQPVVQAEPEPEPEMSGEVDPY